MPPTTVTATDGDFENKIHITWTTAPATVAEGVRIYRDSSLIADLPAFLGASGFDDMNIQGLNTYDYCIETYHSVWGTSTRTCDKGNINITKPQLSATTGTPNHEDRVVLTWTSPSLVDDGFQIYRNNALIANINNPNTLTYSDMGVTSLTEYQYTISAYDVSLGNSERDSAVGMASIKSPISLFASNGLYPDKIQVSWAGQSALSGVQYRIYRNGILATTVPSGTTTYLDEGLNAQNIVQYCITTYKAGLGESVQVCTTGKTEYITNAGSSSLLNSTASNKIIPPGTDAGGAAGFDVDILSDGNAVIGAPYVNCDRGLAAVFSKSDNTWVQQQELLGIDCNDTYGFSVSLDGDLLAVGAPGRQWYELRSYFWSYCGVCSTEYPCAYYNIPNGYLALGCATTNAPSEYSPTSSPLANADSRTPLPIFDGNGNLLYYAILLSYTYPEYEVPNVGNVKVYLKSGNSWPLSSNINITTPNTTTNPGSNKYFGSSVDLQNGALAIGARGPGAAGGYLFNSNGLANGISTTYWINSTALHQTGVVWGGDQNSDVVRNSLGSSITAPIAGTPGYFGRSIAIDGNQMIVGGPDYVAFYNYTGTGGVDGWNLSQVVNPPLNMGFSFGSDVAINGNYAVVGAPEEDNGKGFAYLLQKIGSNWQIVRRVSAVDAADFDYFGKSVAIAGDYAIVGAPYDDNGNGADAGSAYIFRVSLPQEMTASDGTFNNKVQVIWENDSYEGLGVTGVKVYRDDTFLEDIAGTTASTYNDLDAVPGELHQYCIETYGSLVSRICDYGFVRPNGRISGTVKTQQQAGVANVQVCAFSAEGQSALKFSNNGTFSVSTGIDLNNSNYTIEYWAKSTTAVTDFIRFGDGGSNSININMDDNNESWHHYAHVFGGSQNSLYLDGTFVSSTAATALGTTLGNLQIGNAPNTTLDELRIWNIARTQADIQADMNRYLRGDETGLKGYWSFNEGQGSVAGTSVQGSNAHGSLNAVFWTYDRPDVNYCALTDPSGYYEIANVPYSEEREFTIIPNKDNHDFTPDQQVRTITSFNNLANNVNFTDNSTFTLSGDIYYNGTACKQSNVQILVNGNYLGNDTDENGHFAISVTEPDEYVLTPRYQDHTFAPTAANLGYVDADRLGIVIQNTTLRTITGTVSGACNAQIGDVTIQVSSTPSCVNYNINPTSSPYSFNPDNGRFQIQVPPLKYNVRVTDVQQGGQVNVQAINYFLSRSQASNLVDSTNVEDTLHFVFNKPFELEIQDLPTQTTCNGLAYVLSTNDQHSLSFNIFQNYDGNICPADSGTLYINDNVSGIGAISMPFYNGTGYYTLKPDYPNIVAPYLKTFYVSAEVAGGYTQTHEIKVLVTGAKPRESTFITKTPERPDIILRDPPGDASFSYIAKDSTICTGTDWNYEALGSIGGQAEFVVGVKALAGIFFATEVDVAGALTISSTLKLGGSGSGGYESCISTSQQFETPSNPLFTSKEGNLYVGGALNLIYAASDVIDYTNCGVVKDTVLAFQPTEYATTFIYTQNHIQTTLLTQLREIASIYKGDSIAAIAAGNNTLAAAKGDSMHIYLNQIDLWQNVLDLENALTNIALSSPDKQNYSFSAGAVFQNQTTSEVSKNASYRFEQSLDFEIAHSVRAVIAGNGFEEKGFIGLNEIHGNGNTSGTTNSNTVGYVFSDDDIGDYFSVDVGKDRVYGVPVFKTVSGRSSCPHELNTQSRDLPYIVLNSPAFQGDVPPDEAAVFNINFGNASPSGEAWPFRVQALSANNLYGATILLNGSMETGGTVDYFIPAGQEIQSQVYVTRGPTEYNYDNLAVMIYTPCEYENWANGGSIGNVDTVFFSVHFQSPCSGVELVTPIDNWLVQQQDNNNLQITMAGYDATGLKGVLLEYRDDAAGGEWITIADIADTTLLNATYPDSYTYNWNVGSLPDAKYVIRATAYCQTATGSATASSQELHGTIDRAFNGLYGVPQPSDGLLEPGDAVSINFSENINCLQPTPFTPGAQISLVDITTTHTLQYGTDYYVQCNGSGINFVINPNTLLSLDGHLVQAQVAGIKDVNGNVLFSPEVWSFIVLQREVYWNPTIVNATLYQGDSQTVPLQLVNSSPLPRHFVLSTNNADVLQYTANGNTTNLSGNAQLPVSLTIQTATLPFDSTYTDTVRAAVYNNNNTAIEYYANVIVHTTVLAKPPVWEVNPFEFEHSMNMVVQLDMNPDEFVEELSTDEFDKVAVFNNGQIRGVANIERVFTQQGWKYLAFLDVYSHNPFGDSLSFRLWDADKGKQFGSEEDGTVIFADNGIVGSNTTPKILHAKGLVQCLNLHQGWNWISFNVEAGNMSLNQVLQGLRYSQTGDIFRGQDGYAQYQSGSGWVGSLGSIANGESYMIYIQAQTDQLCLVGEAIDASANPIALDAGWNWLGYTAQTPDNVANLMPSTNFVNGDLLRSQTDGFAQHNGSTWASGNLQVMKPGQGYRLYVQNPLDITYPQYMLTDWSYNPKCYEYSMLITGILSVNLIESTDINDLIAAFVPTGSSTCSPSSITQGSSFVRYVPELGRYMVFLTIYGDASALNQPIQFRMNDNSETAEYILQAATDPNTGDTMRFVPDNHIGTLQNPYPFLFSTCDPVTVTATNAGCAGNQGTATANVDIYTGRLGKTCTNPETFTTAAGTNTTYTTTISPFATAWKKARFQYLYTAQELRNAGLREGTISKLGFDVVQKQSVLPIQNFTIKMVGTNLTALNPNNFAIGAEIVYENNYTTQSGWNDLPLDYAFDWDGVSNIIIQVCYDSQTDNFYNDRVRTATTNYTATIGMFDDIGPGCAFEVPQVAYNEKPVLRLGACNVDYQWSNGGNESSISQLSGGTYTVTVSFGNGCVQVRNVAVNSVPVMVVSPSVATAALCNGAADGTAQAIITGGTAPYTYLWSNGQTSSTATGLTAGTYTATVTDGNNCTALTTANITQPTALTATGNIVNAVCNGATGSASVVPTGGTAPYTYLWDNGATTATTNLTAGTHSVTITDAHGCNKTLNNINVTQPTALVANVTQTSSPCSGIGSGSATATAVGGVPPYNFAWSNGQTSASLSNLNAGAYGVTVQDANGCTVSVNNITIVAPAALSTVATVNQIDCNGNNSGSAMAIATGGATPYNYIWSNGQTTAMASNLSPGTYTATITDGNGCTSQTTANITQPTALNAVVGNVVNASCSAATGSATAVAIGGTAPYTYLWNNGQTTATATNLWAGSYAATITDANGCTTTTSANVAAPQPLTVLADGSEILSSTVFVYQTQIVVAGGVAPYSYQWDNDGYLSYYIQGNGQVYLQYGQTANWAVTITDSNDCGTVILGNTPTDIPLSISDYDVANDDGTNSGSIEVVVEGGVGPYTYEWSGPSNWVPVGSTTTNQLNNVPSGWYTVYVTDAAGHEISGWYWVASATRGRSKTDENASAVLYVYPNPVKQHATIEFVGVKSEYVYIELFDVAGKSAISLFEGETQAGKSLFLDIDSKQLTPGTYLCQVRNSQNVIETIRLVIAK